MSTGDPRNSPSDVRSLPVVRALIDAVDHDILQLLARRNELVAEIAQVKRRTGTGIRDYARERDLISDRRSYGERLGLSPDVIESLYRLLLWASRDRQAALKAEVPMDIEPKTVAIIGGKGGMGRCMATMFAELGHAVLIADVDTELTPEQATRDADVVVVSVPIDRTMAVVRRLGPLVRPGGLLLDVTSVKAGPMRAMLESSQASVAGTHPLFGPSVHSLQGQRVVLCRGRGESWFQWLQQMLHARGLSVIESTPEHHDKMMSIVQVLVHFSAEVMGMTLAHLDAPIEETLRFTSPIYLIELLLTARHFGQSADLYAGIEMSNPATSAVTRSFLQTAETLARIVNAKDRRAFAGVFDEVRAHLGAFTAEAMEKSSFLIDRIVERG